MNVALSILGFFVKGKELKALLWIMLALLMIPAFTVIAIAATPQAILDELLKNDPTGTGSLNVPPTGVQVLGGFYYPGDNYAPGNCTYWVYARRDQVGLTIPNTWGNAATWAPRAHDDGYVVDHIPSQYAIMQTPDSAQGLGHVAFVESVDPDGTWHISEMNVGGLYITDHKAVPPSAAARFNFIHTKP